MLDLPPLVPLSPGEPVPWFQARTRTNPRYSFETVAGRYVVLCFFGSAANPVAAQVLQGLTALRGELFDDAKACLFGVSIDPEDEAQNRVADQVPGVRFFWDFDRAVSRRFGAIDGEVGKGPQIFRGQTLVLDPMLRVLARFGIRDGESHLASVIGYLRGLPPADLSAGTPLTAPVLIVPRIFEPAMCRHLIDRYEREGGQDSGFMRQQGDFTHGVRDHSVKRRSDLMIGDAPTQDALRQRIERRLVGEIERYFAFRATRLERYLVACYEGETGGFFRPHRDNTTRATAHRRFAVTINLNAEEFDGGELRFPEFGSRTYRAPTGGAVVFSCSMLHEATPVTRGRRFAFLPFLYDEAGAKKRAETEAFIVTDKPTASD